MSKLSVLMTVYNEVDFVEYAIRSCLPHVDHLVIVEGAYQESVDLGAPLRSDDGTIDVIKKFTHFEHDGEEEEDSFNYKVHHIEANEKTDKDQRNVGLKKIKELNPDGWLLIIDGDEVYDKEAFKMVKIVAHTMGKQNRLAAYFKSLTFVNDFTSHTEQEFPRLFRLTKDCEFSNDNYMIWPDLGMDWFSPCVIKIPYIKYYHYAFCKGDRFDLKSNWWNSRFGKDSDFEYDWYKDADGTIHSPNHKVYSFSGRHPSIMKSHPLWGKSYGKKV